jgi:hypothetical protein
MGLQCFTTVFKGVENIHSPLFLYKKPRINQKADIISLVPGKIIKIKVFIFPDRYDRYINFYGHRSVSHTTDKEYRLKSFWPFPV